jgi:hypothetical protein
MGNNTQSRRRFLRWGAGVAGAVTIFSGFRFFRAAPKKPSTTKMLTQDGTLVEVDIARLNKSDKKASNKDLQEWIKR